MEKFSFKTRDGLQLSGIWHLTNESTKKAIILAHGITVDKDEEGIFVELANLLAQNGFAVFRFDFRGHGESEGKSVSMTIEGELLDLDAVVNEVIKKGYTEIGLLGASFGGGIASLYTAKNQDKVTCLCLWNPCLNYDHTFINPITPWLAQKIGQVRQNLKEKGWTTVGSRNFVLGKRLFNEMQHTFPGEELKNIILPTFIIHGDNDTYVPVEDSKEYGSHLANGKVLIVKNGEHGFQDRKEDSDLVKRATLQFFQHHL